MSYSITTKKAREKLVKARAGEILLPKIKYMAFGTGGVLDSKVIEVNENQESLKNEVMRKEIDSYIFTEFNKCRYSCSLLENELVNEKISEIALVDADGDVVAIKNFSVKQKDDDMKMKFEVEDEF